MPSPLLRKLSFALLLVMQVLLVLLPFLSRAGTLQHGEDLRLRVDASAPVAAVMQGGVFLSLPDFVVRAPHAEALAELSVGQPLYLILDRSGDYDRLSSYRSTPPSDAAVPYLVATVVGTSRISVETPDLLGQGSSTRVEYLVQCSLPVSFLPCTPEQAQMVLNLPQQNPGASLTLLAAHSGSNAVAHTLLVDDAAILSLP